MTNATISTRSRDQGKVPLREESKLTAEHDLAERLSRHG